MFVKNARFEILQHLKKTLRRGSINATPPPPLYLGGGMTLMVKLIVYKVAAALL